MTPFSSSWQYVRRALFPTSMQKLAISLSIPRSHFSIGSSGKRILLTDKIVGQLHCPGSSKREAAAACKTPLFIFGHFSFLLCLLWQPFFLLEQKLANPFLIALFFLLGCDFHFLVMLPFLRLDASH